MGVSEKDGGVQGSRVLLFCSGELSGSRIRAVWRLSDHRACTVHAASFYSIMAVATVHAVMLRV